MNMMQISPSLSVCGQVQPDEVAAIAAAGFTGLVNNRPDGEEPGQPSSAEIEAAAKRHGLTYRHIPIVPGQAGEEQARALAAALRDAEGPVVAFCRTGHRSAGLWKMAQQVS